MTAEAPTFIPVTIARAMKHQTFIPVRIARAKLPKLERERRGAQKYGFRLGFLEENDERKGFVRSIRQKQRRGIAAPGSGGPKSPMRKPMFRDRTQVLSPKVPPA